VEFSALIKDFNQISSVFAMEALAKYLASGGLDLILELG